MIKLEYEFAGRPLSIETGRMAKQADGSVFITFGETSMLTTATAASEPREGANFFPLTVDYLERMYAAGRIPGSFFRREGRPTTREILACRLTDRPIRPLFPDGFRNAVHIVSMVMSFDKQNLSDVFSIVGASAALGISNIPFSGPVSCVRVGRVEGNLLVNPTQDELDESDLDLIVAGTEEAIVMVEGEALEVPETEVLEALEFGFQGLQPLNQMQRDLNEKVSASKKEFPLFVVPADISEKVSAQVESKIDAVLKEDLSKLEREDKLSAVKKEFVESLPEDLASDAKGYHKDAFEKISKTLMRRFVRDNKVRLDGRKLDEIRPVTVEVGVLPRSHGSALFTRGETQALCAVTLGTSEDEQIVDDMQGRDKKSFLLHYNFPPFSVGEAGFMRGPGRRETGHGVLAERSIANVLPMFEDFPYTIRVVSDILESNGSSSMASVCGGTLSLMDAGVKIEAPVSGIAMGLIKEGDDYSILSDIAGWEDHSGDMDFKVAGTPRGVTAIQMDIKITGISREILQQALDQAKAGRQHILEKMLEVIPEPREEISEYAPRMIKFTIDTEKIRDVIGPGGKVIKGIVEETGVKIDIQQDGTVLIFGLDPEMSQKAQDIVLAIAESAEVGKRYTGTVKRIEPYGAFIEILPGTDGLLHVSQFDHRVYDIFEELAVGDEAEVLVVDIDDSGKVRLSQRFDEPIENLTKPSGGGRGDRGDRGGNRGGGGRGGNRGGGRGGRRD